MTSLIVQELLQIEPQYPSPFIEPYESRDTVKIKVQKLLQLLRRNKMRRYRIGQLQVYYELGKLLEREMKTSRYLSQHQRRVAKKIYLIYQPLGIDQIARSKEIAIMDFQRMKDADFKEACIFAENLSSAELGIFEGEDLWDENLDFATDHVIDAAPMVDLHQENQENQ